MVRLGLTNKLPKNRRNLRRGQADIVAYCSPAAPLRHRDSSLTRGAEISRRNLPEARHELTADSLHEGLVVQRVADLGRRRAVKYARGPMFGLVRLAVGRPWRFS